MRLEPSRKFELEVDVRDWNLFAEAVEEKDVDVVALQTDADRVIRFPVQDPWQW